MVAQRALQFWRHVVTGAADARHAQRTAELLRTYGADEELVLAGLLHDQAKPAGTRLWHRVAAVLLDALGPGWRERLGQGEGTFARYLAHAERGAAQARADGRSERVVRLIARHHLPPADSDERLLARADREALP